LTVSSLIYAMHVKYAGLRHGADSLVSFAWAPNAVRFYEVLQVIGSDGTNTLKINAIFCIFQLALANQLRCCDILKISWLSYRTWQDAVQAAH
jgi:hypothetical protein